MMSLISRLPSWLIQHLPVQLARQCVQTHRSSEPQDPVHTAEQSSLKRQLLVDVSVIHQSDARTGIQRVVRALLLELLQAPPAGCSVRPIFATRQRGYCYATAQFFHPFEPTVQTAEQVEQAGKPVQVKRNDIFLGLDLAAHLLPRHQAQVMRWKRSGVKVHIVVYDLLPLQHPEWFNPKTTRNFKRWIKWLAIYADSTVCISQTVKMELSTWLNASFGLPMGRLPASTIVLGANIEASAPSAGLPTKAEFLLARMRSTPAVLMVGTLEPRKGYDQAIAAFEQLWQQPSAAPMLVVVGRPGWKTQALQQQLRTHPQANKRLVWLEDVSDEFLTQLYSTCCGVLVASRAEGFGLPLIEAALHGKPVLARDIPVFKELKTTGLSFFDDNTTQGLANAITQWQQSTLHSEAARTAPHFPTWRLSATQLLNALDLQRVQCAASSIDTSATSIYAAKPMESAA